MESFKGKKILFFCYSYRDYDKYIVETLNNLGAEVTYFSDSPDYFIFKKSPNFVQKTIIKFYNRFILKQIVSNEFDFVFVIKGTFLRISFLEELKLRYPGAKYILYQWDSLKNHNYKAKIRFFDKVFSFDRQDCSIIKTIEYLPLFYIDLFGEKNCISGKQLDLFFIGSGINQRKPVLLKVIESINDPDLRCLFYFISKPLFFRSFFKKEKHFEYLYKAISHKKFLEKFSAAKIVIDIQNENQSGLTMRTFEVLGAGLKLITTNVNIKLEPFYNPGNILVIDRTNPQIPPDFLNNIVEPIDMQAYTLDSFLHKIFGF